MARSVPRIPTMIYGTAWKQEATKELAKKALLAGFDAIDTANQKKHYREDFLGEALAELFNEGVTRESLFLQSKFTYVQGQDHRLPYNPEDDIPTQVMSSFKSSLKNLHTSYLDSYLLHGPMLRDGLHNNDVAVWQKMEDICRAGQARKIGISNVGYGQLEKLFSGATIKPMFVQNRCYAETGWDREVREYCLDNEIVYQGFSLLTANPQFVSSSEVLKIAQRLGVTAQQVTFRYCIQIGILPITGTSDLEHMKQDLASRDLELSDAEVSTLQGVR